MTRAKPTNLLLHLLLLLLQLLLLLFALLKLGGGAEEETTHKVKSGTQKQNTDSLRVPTESISSVVYVCSTVCACIYRKKNLPAKLTFYRCAKEGKMGGIKGKKDKKN